MVYPKITCLFILCFSRCSALTTKQLNNKTQDESESDANNNNSTNMKNEQGEAKNGQASHEKDGCQHVALKSRSNHRQFISSYANSFKNFGMQLPMPLTPDRLLGNFEESLLNGRMSPVGVVDGFYAEIGASGSFFPEHVTIPVHAAFYQVCEDVAASPYLGVINLANVGKRGYKVCRHYVSNTFYCLIMLWEIHTKVEDIYNIDKAAFKNVY